MNDSNRDTILIQGQIGELFQERIKETQKNQLKELQEENEAARKNELYLLSLKKKSMAAEAQQLIEREQNDFQERQRLLYDVESKRFAQEESVRLKEKTRRAADELERKRKEIEKRNMELSCEKFYRDERKNAEEMLEEAERSKRRIAENTMRTLELENSKRTRQHNFARTLEKSTIKKLKNIQLEHQTPRKKNVTPKRKVILVITVEIGDGNLEMIKLHDNETPEEVASAFVAKHQFPVHIIEPLVSRIKDTLALQTQNTPQTLRNKRRMTEKKEEEKKKKPSVKKMTKEEMTKFIDRLSYSQPRLRKEQYSVKAKEEAKKEEYLFSPQITQYKAKNERSGSVFERLYGESKILEEKRKEDVEEHHRKEAELARIESEKIHTLATSKSLLKDDSRDIAVYDRLNKLAKTKEAIREKMLKEKLEQEEQNLDGLTFTPKISDFAKKELNIEENVWERVEYNRVIDEQKREELIKKHRLEDFKEIDSIFKHHHKNHKFFPTRDSKSEPFSPQITNKSKNIVERRLASQFSTPKKHGQYLYEDALDRAKRRESLQDKVPAHLYSFNPVTNVESSPTIEERKETIERLYNSRFKTQEKIDMLIRERKEREAKDMVTVHSVNPDEVSERLYKTPLKRTVKMEPKHEFNRSGTQFFENPEAADKLDADIMYGLAKLWAILSPNGSNVCMLSKSDLSRIELDYISCIFPAHDPAIIKSELFYLTGFEHQKDLIENEKVEITEQGFTDRAYVYTKHPSFPLTFYRPIKGTQYVKMDVEEMNLKEMRDKPELSLETQRLSQQNPERSGPIYERLSATASKSSQDQ
eukprot:TRINITY_DN2183_c0_g2_i1.p1 TRINITY_DN2183_c0_g2~~TRINITY_DN2183_c0_g2_i1.p1  ORF type:complete len:816 (-),score=220.73 TRINITY_DN2183_c0_g2_i1:40-2487(-)